MPPAFKDPQRKRKFGTDITNTHRKRPRFSAKQEQSDSTYQPCPLPPANYASNATRTAKPRFTERRLAWDNELQEEDIENSVKLARGMPTLGTLIRTRCLELQNTLGVTKNCEPIDSPTKWTPWNDTSAVSSHEILINPRRIPLDKANFVRYTDRVVMAVPQPKPGSEISRSGRAHAMQNLL